MITCVSKGYFWSWYLHWNSQVYVCFIVSLFSAPSKISASSTSSTPDLVKLPSLVTVTREGNFTRSGVEEVDEAEIFKGAENRLTMKQTYTWEFQCKYQLQSKHSIVVLKMTSRKGITKPQINQM